MGRAVSRGSAEPKRQDRLGLALAYWSLVLAFLVAGLGLMDTHAIWASFCFLAAVALLIVGMWAHFRRLLWVKVVLTVVALGAFAVPDYTWLAYAMVPSFPFVMPGPLLSPGQPTAFWDFLVVVRGHRPIYNLSVHFQDVDQAAIVKRELERGVSPGKARELLRSQGAALTYRELDPNTVGGTDSQDALFSWHPGNLKDEHYNILLVHRDGTLREILQMKDVRGKWAFAMRLTDERTRKALIECRDSRFPPGGEWRVDLPACFPKFPLAR